MTTIKQAVKQLIDIHTGAVDAKEQALAGFSNAQEQYAHRTAELSVELGEKFAEVVDTLKGDDKTKSLASKTKLWGSDEVRGKVSDIFTQGRKINDGGSVYNAAYSIASKVKKDGLTPAKAAKAVTTEKAAKQATAHTAEGAKKKALASVKKHLRQWCEHLTDEDFEAVKSALDGIEAREPAPAEPEPVEPDTSEVSVTDALPAAADADEELGSLLAGLLNNGVSPEQAVQTVALMRG